MCLLRPFITVESEQEKNNIIGLITALIGFLCWSSCVVTKCCTHKAAAFNFLNEVREEWSAHVMNDLQSRKNYVFMKSFFDLSYIKMKFLSRMEKM